MMHPERITTNRAVIACGDPSGFASYNRADGWRALARSVILDALAHYADSERAVGIYEKGKNRTKPLIEKEHADAEAFFYDGRLEFWATISGISVSTWRAAMGVKIPRYHKSREVAEAS